MLPRATRPRVERWRNRRNFWVVDLPLQGVRNDHVNPDEPVCRRPPARNKSPCASDPRVILASRASTPTGTMRSAGPELRGVKPNSTKPGTVAHHFRKWVTGDLRCHNDNADAERRPYSSDFFLNRTPGPPPFSAMNSIPAASRAVRMASMAALLVPAAPVSNLTRVCFGTPEAATRSSRDQSRNPRAARACSPEMVFLMPFLLADMRPVWH
jgi:hypothetical protein